MALPQFRAAGTYYNPGANGTNAVIPAPAGRAAGDILIAEVYKENSAAVTAPSPTGGGDTNWALFQTVQQTAGSDIFYIHRFWTRYTTDAAAGISSGSATFTWSGSVWRDAVMHAWYDCVATGTPVELINTASAPSGTQTSPPVSGTPAGDERTALWMIGHYYGGQYDQIPTGWTARINAGGGAVSLFTREYPTAAPTGTLTARCINGAEGQNNHGKVASLIALRGAVSPVVTGTAVAALGGLTASASGVSSTPARRLYLTNAAAAVTPPSPAAPGWDDVASAVVRKLGPAPEGAAATVSAAETSAATDWDVLLGRWVSPPLASGGTLAASSPLTFCLARSESDANADQFVRWQLTIVSPDGQTERGSARNAVLPLFEAPTTLTGLQTSTTTSTAVTYSAGDRVVLHLGYRSLGTSTTPYTGTLAYGGTGTPDLADGVTDTSRPGWVDLPASLVFAEETSARSLTWSGHTWTVRKETGGGPGPNEWGDTSANVDTSGTDLILKIAQVGGKWTCAEVDRVGASLGYGTYTWTYTCPTGASLDPNVVFGMFTYDGAASPSFRELDLEVSKWSVPGETSDMWYTVQPAPAHGEVGDNRQSDHVLAGAVAPFTSTVTWQAGQIYWRTVDATGRLLGEHVVTGADVPTPGAEAVIANLWLNDGAAPANGQPITVTLHSFSFTPGATHVLVPASSYVEDFADGYEWALKRGATITGGELVLPCGASYSGAYHGAVLDMRSSSVAVNVTGVPASGGAGSQEAQVMLKVDGANYALFYWAAGGMSARVVKAGAATDAAFWLTYSGTTHKWWRIAYTGTGFAFATSPDGAAWTTHGTVLVTFTTTQLSAMRLEFASGYWGAESGNQGQFKITQVGAPTPVPGAAVAALGGLSVSAAGTRSTAGVAAVALGGLAAATAGVRATYASALAQLGGLTATAVALRKVSGAAVVGLGGLASTAAGTRTVGGAASAALSGLTATASGAVTTPARTVYGSAVAGELSPDSYPGEGIYPGEDCYPGGSGGLGFTASAAGLRVVAGTATAGLGGLTATGVGETHTPNVVYGACLAALGGLQAAAAATNIAADLVLPLHAGEPAHGGSRLPLHAGPLVG